MAGHRFRLLLGERRIRNGVQRLARRISKDYRGTVPVFVGILNGSFIFLADLVREVDLECEIDFITLSAYGRRRATIRNGPSGSLAGKHVIVVEDVVDTGRSLARLRSAVRRRRPRTVRVAALLLKEGVSTGTPPEYVGFRVGPEFVAGYGMDHDGRMRNRKAVYRSS